LREPRSRGLESGAVGCTKENLEPQNVEEEKEQEEEEEEG
jgi:hypothetical protein